MKIDKEKVIEHADQVAEVLKLIAEAAGLAVAAKALGIIDAALDTLGKSMRGEPIDDSKSIKALRAAFASNDAAADEALAAKFDHGGEG